MSVTSEEASSEAPLPSKTEAQKEVVDGAGKNEDKKELAETQQQGDAVEESTERAEGTTIASVSKSGSEDELSEEEKRLRRAERFGTCTEADKRAARAARFGTTPVKKGQKTTKSVSDASASSEEAERRLKRAKRFGLTTPETEAERKRLRAERFGAY
ncbi:hypothetical protein FOZ60_015112 [Perkinsus olseni]|uniref:THO1-MOS11 C-terminal domain-containing protein n=1 Tax=Perkinsus olseni TaxID=32597 RepID=A0A7J6S521_PEROL|nr:hypothetical protein FOZ60_015112 [Perkinsus olseni]KAF4728049.1 hypothetical protein FOZ62_002173 [Perkinsus olseni]